MHQQKLKGYIAAATSAISFGLIPLFVVPIKQAAISMDVTLFYRFFVGAAMIGIYMGIRSVSFKLHGSELPKLAIMGVVYALSSEFLFLGYDVLSPGIASTLIYTYPIIIAVILSIGFGERISPATKASITLASIGVVCMSWEGEELNFNLLGVATVMLGSLSYAVYMLIVNKGRLRASGITVTFYSLLFSALFYAFKSMVNGQPLVLPSTYWLGFITCFSLVTTVVSVLAMVLAINLIGSTPTAVMGALEPVVAVWLSVLFLGEKASWNLFTGLVLVMAALLVNILGRKIRRTTPSL